MNPRNITRLLSTLTTTFSLAALASILLAILLPVATEVPAATGSLRANLKDTTSPTSMPTVAGLDRIWALQLRQKLSDPTPGPARTVTTPTLAPPPVTLVGTIGDSLAMFKSGDAIVVRAIGESFDGVQLLAIHTSQVEVKYNGRVITLDKPPESPRTPGKP